MAEGAPFEKLTSVYSDHEGLRENFSGHLKGLKAEKVFLWSERNVLEALRLDFVFFNGIFGVVLQCYKYLLQSCSRGRR